MFQFNIGRATGETCFNVKRVFQKQPSRSVLKKRCLKICSILIGEHSWCRSVISINLQSNFIEIALRRGCSAVNFLHIFRTPFPRSTSGWLLLVFIVNYEQISHIIAAFQLLNCSFILHKFHLFLQNNLVGNL